VSSLGLLGVPSSAAAHWPGQEKAPAALRAAGIVKHMGYHGIDVVDYGDRPTVRWRPLPYDGQPHDMPRVLDVLVDAREHIVRILVENRLPLVIGGECTLTIALVSAAVDAGHDVALIYFDGGQDVLSTAANPEEGGSLDAMGVAHMLDLPGAASDMAAFGPRRPLLTPDAVCFFGYGAVDEAFEDLSSPRVDAAGVARDPRSAAHEALDAVNGIADRFLVHFDVDVINFLDLPAADVPQFSTGLSLGDAMTALSVLVAHPGFLGMTFVEFNPDHGDADGSTARTLAGALAAALRSVASHAAADHGR
jgi:arginase